MEDIFEPYEKLIEVTIEGEKKLVPENNSILRCLQFLDAMRISSGDLCWNGTCTNCQAWIDNDGKQKAVMACRTKAFEGMKIVKLSKALRPDDLFGC